MSVRPTARELHQAHELERATQRRDARTAAHEAEARRLIEERWQRRLLPLLANDVPVETDFGGCFG